MSYNVGIIGCGVIGKRLAHFFNIHPLTSIKAVCDLDESLAESLAIEYNVKSTKNFKDLLADPEIDIIYIGVPPSVHYPIVIDSLRAHKHIICEKPLSISYKECIELINEKNKHPNLLTTINLPFRFNSGVEKLKKLLFSEKKIGELVNIEFNIHYPAWPRMWQDVQWLKTKKEGGPLREVGTHFFFLLNELFNKVTKVTCNVIFPQEDRCESEVDGVLIINNSIKCKLSLKIGGSGEDINDMIFNGTNGSLVFSSWSDLCYINGHGKKSQYTLGSKSSLDEMLTEFTRILEMKKELYIDVKSNLVSFEDAAKAQLILDAIYNSNGKEIIL